MSIDDVSEIDTNFDESSAGSNTNNFEDDKRLKNWGRWIQERKRIHRKIEKNFGRRPSKLLINAAEDSKGDDELRRMIEYARIPNWDKYRGNPLIWKVPPMLNKRCPNDLEFRVTLTQPELGVVPDIEYVKIPDAIKREKHVISTRSHYGLNKSNYMDEMLKQERVLELQPHRPDLKELVVVGKTLQNPTQRDVQSSSEISDEEFTNSTKRMDYLLSLNNLQLFANDTGIRSVKLFSEATTDAVKFLELSIHNNSETALRFTINKYSKRRVLGKTIQEYDDDVFFWNKNIHILQPDEKIDFFICFKSKICRTYTQTFQLLTHPNLWDKLIILIISQVNIIKYNFESWCSNLTLYLENQIRSRIISETLDNCLQKIPRKKSDIVMYSYDKTAIFEAINAFYSNNIPYVRYVYDKNVVGELEEFYKKVRLDRHPELWDYRIETLRTVTKHRESYEARLKLQEDLENLRLKIDQCKIKREQLENQLRLFWEEGGPNKNKSKDKSKPAKSQSTKPKSSKKEKSSDLPKKKMSPGKFVEPTRPRLSNTLSDELETIISKLRSQTTWKIENSRKMQLCYTLLCAYIDKICAECADLEFMFGITKVNPNILENIYIEQNRIFDEKLDESNIQYPRITDLVILSKDKPAPPWSSTIPIENFEERYVAFKAEKSVVGLKPGDKNTPKKTTPAEIVVEDVILNETNIVKEENIPQKIYNHYRNNLYIIFNRNLWMLVDDILATFELIPQPSVKADVLGQVGLSAVVNLGEDEDEVRIFDLKRTINEVLKEPKESSQECTCECICDLSQSILDLFTTYQSKSCYDSKESDNAIAAETAKILAKKFNDTGVMTTPSIELFTPNPSASSSATENGDADDGECGRTVEDGRSIGCMCKSRSSGFYYYDSLTGFDVDVDLSSSGDQSCKD